MEKIPKGANKIHFTICNRNYFYSLIVNFALKFSPCSSSIRDRENLRVPNFI